MYALATCLASVLRGTTTDDYLDTVDAVTVATAGLPAAIRERTSRVSGGATGQPRVVRTVAGQVRSGTDVRIGDRLRDDTHGGVIYTVENVTDPGGPGNTADLELELKRVTAGGLGALPGLPPGGGGGTPGPGTTRYDQTTAATVWLVDHNLGRYPAAVALFMPDLSEQYREYKIQHLSVNSLRVSMDIPTAGVALLI